MDKVEGLERGLSLKMLKIFLRLVKSVEGLFKKDKSTQALNLKTVKDNFLTIKCHSTTTKVFFSLVVVLYIF